MSAVSWYRWQGQSLLLYCHLQPGASRNEVAGTHGDRLKIRIKAPPVDGKANKALLRYMAELFAVAPSAVAITAGSSSRQKTVSVSQPTVLPESLAISPP